MYSYASSSWRYVTRIKFTAKSRRVAQRWKHWSVVSWKISSRKHSSLKDVVSRKKQSRSFTVKEKGHDRHGHAQEVHSAHSCMMTRREEKCDKRQQHTLGPTPSNDSFLRNQRPPVAQQRALPKDRLSGFNYKEQCLQDTNCDYWHSPFCIFHKRDQCRSGNKEARSETQRLSPKRRKEEEIRCMNQRFTQRKKSERLSASSLRET